MQCNLNVTAVLMIFKDAFDTLIVSNSTESNNGLNEMYRSD